jgi:hypothetical protein
MKWLGFDLCPRERRDRLGSGFGLLGGDSSVLDGKICRVAGREHAVESPHATVNVDRNESIRGYFRNSGAWGAQTVLAAPRFDRGTGAASPNRG